MKRKTYTSTEVKARYNAKHYEQMSIVVPKGSLELIKERANTQGMSVSGYIRHLIAKDAPECLTTDIGGGGGSITLAEIWSREKAKESFWEKNKAETIFKYRMMYPEKTAEEIENEALSDMMLLPPEDREKAEKDILSMIKKLKKLA